MSRALGLAVLVSACVGALTLVPSTAAAQDVPLDAAQVLDQSLAHSRRLRSGLSARARARIDEVGAHFVGTRWLSDFGLGRFVRDDDLLVFEIDGWRLPFVPLDTPEHWLVASGVYTTTGTAEVLVELDQQRHPVGMSWLQRQYVFTRVPDDAFALSPDDVDGLLHALTTALREHWVERERVEDVVSELTARRDAYAGIGDAEPLAERLAADLRALTGDISAGASFVPRARDAEPPEAAFDQTLRKALAAEYGGGLGVVTTVRGDVGFIEVLRVLPAELSASHLARAFKQVDSARALILDVRRAVGGAPDGGHLIQAFVLPDSVEIGRLETPATGEVTVVRTPPLHGASRFLDRPLFVLTSQATLGAGEELAYTLQALGFATVVGERTAGAAQPARTYPVHAHVDVRIPVTRMILAATGDNWQGRGVEPNVPAPADAAFEAAWAAAMDALGEQR